MFTENRKYIITRIALAFVLIAGIFGVQPAQAGTIAFGWANSLGSGFGADVFVDESGNVYNTGSLNGEIFISKHGNNGNPTWLKSLAGNGVGFSIAVDGDGNVLATGPFQNTVDFDPGPGTYNLSSAGGRDVFIVKLDGNGDFVWAKKIGGAQVDEAYKVAVDGSGNVYVTGTFLGTVDFDPGAGTYNLTSAGPGNDIFIFKLDVDGNFLWAKNIEVTSGGGGIGTSIVLDGSGNIYTTGVFSGTADFDPGAGVYNLTSTSMGAGDGFISKFDNDGNFVWAQDISYFGADMGMEIALDDHNNVYAVGSIDRIFIIKLNVNGDFIWLRNLVGSSTGYAIAIDGSGNVLATGSFAGTIDFDPGDGVSNLTSAGNYDIFISKLDTNGNFGWVKQIGGSAYDSGEAITLDDAENVYLTGEFSDTVDFDPGTGTYNLTATTTEVFVAKSSAVSQVIYVKQDATGANDGSSWTDAYTDLQSALSAASSGDEIWVAAGTYKPTSGADRTVSFVLKNDVAVYGGFAGTETQRDQRNFQINVTILSGDIGIIGNTNDNSYHVVVGSNTDNSAVLDGFIVTGGNADGDSSMGNGGGLYNYIGSPTVRNVTFSNNSGVLGGGMFNDGEIIWNGSGSNPILSNVTFINNSATGEGGGMENRNNCSPILTNVAFIGNTSNRSGGGMLNLGGNPILTNVTFSGNTAALAGGGMASLGSDSTLTNVTFNGNSSGQWGGGMDNGGSSSTLTNVTFNENSASTFGGAISNHYGGNLTLINVTMTGNSAVTYGDGVYKDSDSILSIRNSILYNNGEEIYGTADVTYSIVEGGYTGMGNLNASPLLGELADNGGFTQTMALFPGSPAIDAGDDSNCPAADQRGVTRPQGSGCDIGAYEYVNQAPTDITITSDSVDEDQPVGTTVGTFSTTDPDAGDTFTHSFCDGTDDASFSITGNALKTAAVFDFETKSSYSICIRSTDSGGLSTTKTFVIGVNDLAENTAPTNISLSASSVNENQPVGTTVGTLSTTDSDAGDTHTYTFCGGTNDASFSIAGDTLKTAAVFDYETKSSYSICIRSTDSGGLSTTETFVINVNNLIDTQTFGDVSTTYWAWQFIERLYNAGITGGCSTTPLSYCPESEVTRAQMAVFLERGLHYPTPFTAPNVAPTFSDTVGHWAEDWIEALKNDGVTAGCAAGLYCPENPVTRAQMAVFLLKAKYGSSYSPPAVGTSTGFGDVPTDHWASAWIKQLAAEQITGGCGGGNYCLESPVTRAQMAVFLVKTFGLP